MQLGVVVLNILYTKIDEYRKKLGITIYAIEMGVGFPKGTIKNWKISFPSWDKILKVANFLDVSVDYLVGNTNNQLSHKSQNDLTVKIAELENQIKQFYSVTQQFQNDVQGILNSKGIKIQLENLNILNDPEENSPTSP